MKKQSKFVVLGGSERKVRSGSKATGAANPNEHVQLTIKVRGKQPLPEISGRPGKIMSRDDIRDQFGATAEDIQKVSDALSALGLTITGTNPAARSVYVAGSVKTVEQAFKVRLFYYTHESGDYRGRKGFVHIPAELKGIVEGIFGLDSRKMINKRGHPRQRKSFALTAASAVSRAWFFPAELAAIYNYPAGDGTGESIGILEFGGGYFPADLQSFCSSAQVNVPNVVPVSVDNVPTNVMDDYTTEVMMDIEVVAGVCPNATIPVYFGNFTEKGWIDILDSSIHDTTNNPKVLSVSYGLAEGQDVWTAAAMTTINSAFQQAAMLGVTICISSGDDGSDAQVGDGYAHVNFPASSPYVLGVGGTNLTMTNGTREEVAWKDGDGLRADGGGSSGGGVSAEFGLPAWQSSISINSVDPGASQGRVVPDVAAHAETDAQTTGYFIVVGGQSGTNGGTSAAAPMWAALVGLMNQALQPQNKQVGFLTPLFYQNTSGQNTTVGAQGCNDITQGDNISAAIGGYSAGPGYDAVSGWGSPNGTALLSAITPLL